MSLSLIAKITISRLEQEYTSRNAFEGMHLLGCSSVVNCLPRMQHETLDWIPSTKQKKRKERKMHLILIEKWAVFTKNK